MTEGKTEDLWNPYRELHATINKFLVYDPNTKASGYSELENVLRRSKQSFFSLLSNIPKSTKSREELKKGMEDGITIRGVGHQTLSKELYQEVIIISDMFELNEFVALDLLCTAQILMPFYPGLTRGLVAITLYYDGRKYFVSALRTLIQARSGVHWSLKLPKQTQRFIDNYMAQLYENGLFTRILELLKTLDLTKEMDKLQSNLALGGPKHRKQVTDAFMSIKVILADCVFLWSTQSGLNKQTVVALIQHLREVRLEEEASGKLDKVTLYLIMALLNAVDLSVLHTREDGEELVQQLPILCEEGFIDTILNELSPNKYKWVSEGLQSVGMFAFSVCLSSLRLVPQGQQLQNAIDCEDEFVDRAIIMRVFEFMTHVLLENELAFTEEMIYKRLHHLFCDFIVQMYPKVKELRIKADETARTIQAYVYEGLELPGNLPRYFENLLTVIAKLYSKDPLKLQLMLDYWCPSDGSQNQTHYRAHPRSVSLFKFVKLAGDMLPPSLFVNYLKMLTSLSGCQQAAINCFNMLKQPSGLNNNLTWEHFFMSFNQYYCNLKQEVQSGNDSTVYRHSRLYHKGITPQEIEGLHAVLGLIKTIANHDDLSRLAFCEHPGWAPMTVLLGLVSCSVPIPLKADLLLALASLCKSHEVAAQMWNNLEASQILVTIPTTSSYQPRGIQTELDEVESRLEEYPLTKAWLVLMDVLTDSGIPRTLGAGPRKPGFDPYLTFIINSVFTKYNKRSYKNSVEKWQIAAACLKLFSKFLMSYEPEANDFPDSNKPNEFNSPPGFHLMLQLHTKSELLCCLLQIINEGNKMYDLFTSFTYEQYIDECILHSFSIIERCLILQPHFFNLLSSSNSPVLVISMNQLLFTINPASGKPDHILNIMKYLGYQDGIPKQSLLAVKIITLLTSSRLVHSKLINILLSSTEISTTISNGFVECLDQAIDEDNEFIGLTKKAIFFLLKQCLPYSTPNLSHYLFGYDIKNVSKTVFQIPGVLNFPRTCIHSLIRILQQRTKGQEDSDPSLMESVYHMLYALCSNSKTAEPILRLIRMHPNFFKDHINYCYKHYNEGIYELDQLSWILKVLAIELRLASINKQIVNLKQLTVLLVGLPAENKAYTDSFSMIRKTTEPTTEDCLMTIENLKQDNFLIKLISDFNFDVSDVVSPEWGFFEQSALDNYLSACQTDSTPKLIDIRRLHRNLVEEVTAAQGSTALGQRQAMMDEIQKVLLHAVNINNSRRTVQSKSKFIDAWRQVTQVLIIFLPNEIITAKERILLELYLLENILQKVVNASLTPEVCNYLSGTVLLLLQNLRQNHINEEMQNQIILRGEQKIVKSMIELNLPTMKAVLNYIIEWVLMTDNKLQKLRRNLYGALAIYLQLITITEKNQDCYISDSFYVSRLDNSKFKVKDEVSSVFISSNLLSSFGEKFIEALCYDAAGAQEICKMLSMSCFSLLVSLSGNVNWITHMSSRGYLKHIIDSILISDADLRAILEPNPDNIKCLYLYDAKMALLVRIATTRIGAELLLEQRFLSMLSRMKVYDFHPELTKHLQMDESDNYIMSIESRYLQIWEPTLNLSNAILTSLGTDHKAAVSQIINFILSHLDVIELILRSGNASLSCESLKELSLLTSVIARTANNDLLGVLDSNEVPKDNRTHLFRIQKLMLSLVPRFVLLDNNIRELLSDTNTNLTSYQTSDRLSYAMDIIANLLLYCRNIIKNNGINHDSVGVVFLPNLNEAWVGPNANQKNKSFSDHAPSLGVVVQDLINTVSYYHKEKGTMNFLTRKVTEIPDLGTVDLKEFVSNPAVDISILREEAIRIVSSRLKMKKSDIDHCMLIIEHAMYIIWTHLDYYMHKAIPKAKNFGLQISNPSINMDATLASASEAMWKVSTDDISYLKQGLVSIFNDSFCRQLVETSQGRSESDIGFLEVLLRKIKRLIQFVPVK